MQRLAPLLGFSNLMIAQPALVVTGKKRVRNLPDRPCAGAETAAVPPRKRSFGASGLQKTGRCSREGQFPQPKPDPPRNQRFPKKSLIVAAASNS